MRATCYASSVRLQILFETVKRTVRFGWPPRLLTYGLILDFPQYILKETFLSNSNPVFDKPRFERINSNEIKKPNRHSGCRTRRRQASTLYTRIHWHIDTTYTRHARNSNEYNNKPFRKQRFGCQNKCILKHVVVVVSTDFIKIITKHLISWFSMNLLRKPNRC